MKLLPSVLLLACSMGLGVFAHHLTEEGRGTRRTMAADSRPAALTSRGAASAQSVSTVAEALRKDGTWTPRDWINLDERLSSLSADQFPLLAAELAQRDGGKLQYDAYTTRILLERWAAVDTRGLLQAAEQSRYGLKLILCVSHGMLHDPAAVAAAIRKQAATDKDGELTARLWSKAFEIPGKRDPAGALHQAEALGLLDVERLPRGLEGLSDCIYKWARQDPSTAMAFAQKYPSLQHAAFFGWLSEQPEAAFTWIEIHPEIAHHGDWMQNGLREWMEKDAPAALAWREAHPGKVADGKWLEDSLVAYVAGHPREADKFCDLIEDMRKFVRAVAVGLARESPEDAAKWIGGLEREEGIGAYIEAIYALEQDPAAGVALCKLMPQYSDDASTDVVFLALALRDPGAAVQALTSGHFSEDYTRRCLPKLMGNWLADDPRAARAFIESQPPSELTGRLMLQSSRILVDGDANSARDFALGLPDSAMRLGACREVMREQFLKSDERRAEAPAWIAAISDPAIKVAMEQMLNPKDPAP